MFSVLYFVINILIIVAAKNENYMGHKVYSIKFDTQEQQDKFYGAKNEAIDFWRKPSFQYGVVGRAMVPLSHTQWFEEVLQDINIEKEVYVEDVYEYLNEKEQTLARTSNEGNRVFDFDGYYSYSEILSYLNTLQETFATSTTNVELIEYGTTEENRLLVYLKISNPSATAKPVIIIEAGVNPREWITIPSALNIANEVLNDTRYLDAFEWIIVPVLNPDGYEYTHTMDRLWSKSMSTKSNLGFICPGVNINRNFDIDWLHSGSSSSPCSHLYGGIEPFSEVESQFIRSLVEEYGSRTSLYISFQSNGGFITYPWQYEMAASGMFIQHYFLGISMTGAMSSYYNIDVASVAAGDRTSGTSTDYVQSKGILYSLNIAIDQGDDGITVPEDEIFNKVQDVWRSVAVAADNFI